MAGINPLDFNLNNIFATAALGQYTGGVTPKVEPKVEPQVGGVQGVQPSGQAFAGFKAEKWQQGLGGLPTGPLGEDGAVYVKDGRAGARLNVDAFSVC